jgi:hypothetical protein
MGGEVSQHVSQQGSSSFYITIASGALNPKPYTLYSRKNNGVKASRVLQISTGLSSGGGTYNQQTMAV